MPLEIIGLGKPEVKFVWDEGVEQTFSARELRIRCNCAHCVSETTGQRLLDPATSEPGGAPTVALPSAPPAARGVAVRKGPINAGKVGKGGEGGGTGAGSGAGAGDQPLSVAMIKKQAMPKGDYGYFDARKDYPPEAKQLGIQGKIRVRLTVSDQGKVTAAVLINKLGHGLDEVAMARAKKLEFEPALDSNDRPVSSFVFWTFSFTLPDAS